MDNAKDNPIRREAEMRATDKFSNQKFPSTGEDIRKTVHELQVHQIELEIQNEELLKIRFENEQLLARYTELYDFAPVAYVSLDDIGKILQSNLAAASLLNMERQKVQNKLFSEFIVEKDRQIFAEFLNNVFDSTTPCLCTVQLEPAHDLITTIQIEAKRSPDNSECRAILQDISERLRYEAEIKEYQDNLNDMVADKTQELRRTLNLMVGRENRMSSLKDAIKILRKQLIEAGIEPLADDPIMKNIK